MRCNDSLRQGVWVLWEKFQIPRPRAPKTGTPVHGRPSLLLTVWTFNINHKKKKKFFLKELKIWINFLINDEFIEIGLSSQIFLNHGTYTFMGCLVVLFKIFC